MTWWLQLGGLVLGFLGALFVTISQQPGGGVFEGRRSGEVAYLVLEHSRLWKAGLAVMDALISEYAEGPFGAHMHRANRDGLLRPAIFSTCDKVNEARNQFLHWKPGRFRVPSYQGAAGRDRDGFRSVPLRHRHGDRDAPGPHGRHVMMDHDKDNAPSPRRRTP